MSMGPGGPPQQGAPIKLNAAEVEVIGEHLALMESTLNAAHSFVRKELGDASLLAEALASGAMSGFQTPDPTAMRDLPAVIVALNEVTNSIITQRIRLSAMSEKKITTLR